MKTPKRVSITKRPSAEQIQDSKRWQQFTIHSGIRFEDLSNEWVMFFDAQAEISTAQTELVRLIDIAISKDEKK